MINPPLATSRSLAKSIPTFVQNQPRIILKPTMYILLKSSCFSPKSTSTLRWRHSSNLKFAPVTGLGDVHKVLFQEGVGTRTLYLRHVTY